MVRAEGYPKFTMHWHTELWHSLNAKDRSKGWGVDVGDMWYWYSSWIEQVRRHCSENLDRYR